MNPAILVGRRGDGGHRNLLWDFCSARWNNQVGWPIMVGYHDLPPAGVRRPREPFSLSLASNRAYGAACRALPAWDVALYAGADWALRDAEQAVQAVRTASQSGKLTFAHDEAVVMAEDATARILAGDAGFDDVCTIGSHHANTFGGVLAVPRALWEEVGGFDERFQGWGWEDLAFWSACCALGGGYERVPGLLVHLWHPHSREEKEDRPGYWDNEALGRRYLAAKGSRDLMLEILAERAAA